MKILMAIPVAGLWTGAALAHPGVAAHSHDGPGWIVLSSVLGAAAACATIALLRRGARR